MSLLVLVVLGIIGVATIPALTRGWTESERKLAYYSLAAHLVSAPAQEFVYRKIYGSGDMLYYLRFGEMITEILWHDPGRALPEVINLLFQREHRLPMVVLGQGSSTGSMYAVSALLGAVVGSDLTSQGALIGLVSFSGKCASHSVFRGGLAPPAQRLVAIAQLLVPTAVFWSSALLKEPVIAGAVGWLIFALARLIERRSFGAIFLAVCCVTWIGLFKAYLLVGFATGFGAWVYVVRAGVNSRVRRIRPLWLGVGFAASVLLVGAVGKLFPEYDVEQVGIASHSFRSTPRSGARATNSEIPRSVPCSGRWRSLRSPSSAPSSAPSSSRSRARRRPSTPSRRPAFYGSSWSRSGDVACPR